MKKYFLYFLVLAILGAHPNGLYALAPHRDEGSLSPVLNGMDRADYVRKNLDWFVSMFDSYNADGILSDAGIMLLNNAKGPGKKELGDQLFNEMYRVMKYFRGIRGMSKDDIFKRFPKEYFAEVDHSKFPPQDTIALKLVDGCANMCVFCPVQKKRRMKCMPYPLIIMLANNPRITFEMMIYEPLFYKDPSGALFDDVAKICYCTHVDNGLKGIPDIVTHGYSKENESLAIENIDAINSSDHNYYILLSVHPANAEYFRLRKTMRVEEITRHYVDRYVDLVTRISERHKRCVRYVFPPDDVDDKYAEWKEIMPEIRKGIQERLAALDVDYNIEFRLPGHEYTLHVISKRGARAIKPEARHRLHEYASLYKGSIYGLRPHAYVSPKGTLCALFGPTYVSSKVLFSKFPPDLRYEYVQRIMLLGMDRASEHMFLEYLRDPELNALVKEFYEGDHNKDELVRKIADLILAENYPVSIEFFNIFGSVDELGLIPEYKDIDAGSIMTRTGKKTSTENVQREIMSSL